MVTNSQSLIGKTLPGTGRVIIPCARCHKRCNSYRDEGEYYMSGKHFFCYECIEICISLGRQPEPQETKYVECRECMQHCRRKDGEYDPSCPDFFYCDTCWELYDPGRKIRGPKRHHKDVDEERDKLLDLDFQALQRVMMGIESGEQKEPKPKLGEIEAEKKRLHWFITEYLRCQYKPVSTDDISLVVDCDFRMFGFATFEAFLRDVPNVSVSFNMSLMTATAFLTDKGRADDLKNADATDADDFKKSGPDYKTGRSKAKDSERTEYFTDSDDSDLGFGASFRAKPKPFMADDDTERQYRTGPKDRHNKRGGRPRRKKRRPKGPKPKDYYKELGIAQDANDTAIRKAYRKAALKMHPDRHKTEKEKYQKLFVELTAMYGTLMNPEKRRKYDKKLMSFNEGDAAYDPGNFQDEAAAAAEEYEDDTDTGRMERVLSLAWWYSANGQTVGPIPLKSLLNSFIAGSINDTTYVIDQKKVKHWTALRQVTTLFTYLCYKRDGRPKETPKRKDKSAAGPSGPDWSEPPKMSKEDKARQKRRDERSGKNLPPGWKQYRDKKGRLYYYHRGLNRTVWKKPRGKKDPKTGKPYVPSRWPPPPWRPMWNIKRERLFANHHTEKEMAKKDFEEMMAKDGIYSKHDTDPIYDWEEYFDDRIMKSMWINRKTNAISMTKPQEGCFRALHSLDPDAW